ncbi:50S ribosomal protein L23 [Mycoplasmopsis californica]|uniref:Large ribosomal subunit protein uL23 n=1 Tax=Mycoplasmopsis equigenitalium TaxID=114883 RepID=A0ABY5J4M6_9BACT|nr:50S ribosomal protein L23 [Mycoplasmopsis equigenitalium]UUD37087.1 50S ribosomal protein L23 [Mycoplasmopsis equigenitalium]VEU69612.1 50S ribosomal protein L23 [Mycoplasmopsis californica]
MHYTEVIKSPIMTEKTNLLAANNNEYVFKVDINTNKIEVKKAIEFIYKVKVARVNIIRLEKQPTSLGRSKGWTDRYKKAIVKLIEGDTINFMPEDDKTKATKAKDEKAKSKVDKKTQQETSEKLKAVEAKIAAKKEKAQKTKNPKIKVEDEAPKAPEATLIIKDQPAEKPKRARKVTKKIAEEIIAEADEKQKKAAKAKKVAAPKAEKTAEEKPKRATTKKAKPAEATLIIEDKPKKTAKRATKKDVEAIVEEKPKAKKVTTKKAKPAEATLIIEDKPKKTAKRATKKDVEAIVEEKPKPKRAKKPTKLQAQLESAGAGEDMLELAEILESARKKIKTVENKIVKEAITKSINETGEIPIKKTRRTKKTKEE